MEMPDYQPRQTPADALRTQYWRQNRRLTLALLGVWTLVSFVLVYFARDLSFTFFGWPFGFWVASQGALIVYCLIVAYYAYAMRKMDEEFKMPSSDEG